MNEVCAHTSKKILGSYLSQPRRWNSKNRPSSEEEHKIKMAVQHLLMSLSTPDNTSKLQLVIIKSKRILLH